MLDLPMHGDNFSFLVMIHRPVSPLASDDEFLGAAELLDIMCSQTIRIFRGYERGNGAYQSV